MADMSADDEFLAIEIERLQADLAQERQMKWVLRQNNYSALTCRNFESLTMF